MKKDKLLSTALGLTIVVVCCASGLTYRNDRIKEDNKNIESVKNSSKVSLIDKVKELHGKTKDEVYSMLGTPKEVYKDKVHTYIDNVGKYDLLINESVKNIVINIKPGNVLDEKMLLLHLGIQVDNKSLNEVKKEGKKVITVKDKGNYSKIEMCFSDANIIETVKIDMK